MREEKLSGDIHEAFFALSGASVFDRIAGSKDQPFCPLTNQADTLGLDIGDIALQAPGECVNPDLRKMYDDLLAQGSRSETDALRVGVAIDRTDIADLAAAIDDLGAGRPASVDETLMNGSYHHLAAFEAAVIQINPGTLFGTEGADRIAGDARDNLIYGRGGNDTLAGLARRDTVYGENGSDKLTGGSGRDKLFGAAGPDRLYGGSANDRLFGGSGTDRLIGGTGDDRLKGGAHADDFVFRGTFGNATVGDFDTANNRDDIELRDVASITD